MSNRFCKKSKDPSVLAALDFIILAKIIDEKIHLFYCGEFNWSLEAVRDGLWELFPAIEENAQFPYRVCNFLEDVDKTLWNIHPKNVGMTHINIVNNEIVSFHDNKDCCEPWENNTFDLEKKVTQLTYYFNKKARGL